MLTHVFWTAVICAPVFGGLGWWLGKKGAASVKGDVSIAVQGISKKV